MKKSSFIILPVLFLFLQFSISCSDASNQQNVTQTDTGKYALKHPDWVKSANIYEVNLRQYTKDGTIKEFEAHLPRLKELGVDILWFMPVFPIGSLNRKVSQTALAEELKNPKEQEKYLGSYYAIKDYMAINPEFGTMDEFKELVKKIHEMGMHVILDIAVNHTAWDHPWIKSHPEYYTRIEKGKTPWNPEWMKQHPDYYKFLQDLGMTYPIDPNETDWWDTADLNYANDSLRNEMLRIFKFWITEFDVDGYRCDVAGWVPTDFWESVRAELDKIKPVFMLAEAEQVDHHYKSFDASYAWEFHHIMNKIAKGENNVTAIDAYFAKDTVYPENAIRMNFITNHDENSWNGTVKERLGDASRTMSVLYYTIPGMPLIYSGQEVGLDKRLKFFEKDEINWNGNNKLEKFYKQLNQLKELNQALWNGEIGAPIQKINTSNDSTVYAFIRQKADNKVLVVMNLSSKDVEFSLLTDEDFSGLKNYFEEENYQGNNFKFKAWDYKVFTK